MSRQQPPTVDPGAPPTTTWERFWFKPADPTTLGLVRICCGLITLYTTIAYSYDLFELCGKDAWLDLPTRLLYVRERPMYVQSSTWETPLEQRARLPVPETNSEEEKRIQDYIAHWTIDPRMVYVQGTPAWSVWFHVTDPPAMIAVQCVFILAAFLFTIGLGTRVTSALTWFAQMCYIHRAPTGLFGVDTMMGVVLLYCMIGPSGAALSVDRLIAHWWRGHRLRVIARWRRLANGVRALFRLPPVEMPPASATPVPVPWEPPAPSTSANLAIRLLQIHVCIIYAMAGLSKLQGGRWWDGNAIWYTLANYEFAPMEFLPFKAFLRYLTLNRPAWELFMTFGAYFTLFFEIGYFLIWLPRFRWVFLSMALVLHGGIGFFMGLQTFSLMMLTMNMAFLPPELVRQWLSRLGRIRAPAAPKSPTAAPPPAERTPVAAAKATAIRKGQAPVRKR